jgi:hypothetical protein
MTLSLTLNMFVERKGVIGTGPIDLLEVNTSTKLPFFTPWSVTTDNKINENGSL